MRGEKTVKKISFLFGIHNHQPVGNFEYILVEAYQRAYRPFFDVFENHRVKMTVHFSGWLLEWLARNHPEYIEKLRSFVHERRLEIATGGYYEPIIPVIPEKDRIEQIMKLSRLIEELFDTEPVGMWLAERVWEPSVTKSLVEAGVRYAVVDDNHFRWAGLFDDELNGYYVTEEDGRTLSVFPISKRLRYLIPFEPPEATLNHLLLHASVEGGNAQVMFDDGEKFGVWPQTHSHVYEKGWLEDFFQTIENTEWIETLTFKEYLEKYPPKGRVYLPISSYLEMTEWALPSKARKEFEELLEELNKSGEFERLSMFLKGGMWRSFLAKYTESNNMHKKMLRVSRLLSRVEDPPEEAKKRYLMAQANDAYWHGVFGGLYLPHLRDAVYTNLVKAESLLNLSPSVEVEDLDCDGFEEVLISSKEFNLYFDPHYGGRLFELDVKKPSMNLLNNLTRRYEPYHDKLQEALTEEELRAAGKAKTIHDVVLTREKGLENLIAYDWYERYALIDHFFGEWTTLEGFSKCRYPEQGDFVNQPYQYSVDAKRLLVKLWRAGHVWVGSEWVPINVEKEIFPEDEGIRVTYTITNLWNKPVDVWFGIENNVNLLAPESQGRYYIADGRNLGSLKNFGSITGKQFGVVDEYRKVCFIFESEREMEHWYFPIYTVSYSEGGFEKVYQGSSLTSHLRLHLSPKKPMEISFKIALEFV